MGRLEKPGQGVNTHAEAEGRIALKGGRDVENILNARSQIQSVTVKRSIQGSHFQNEKDGEHEWEGEFATGLKPSPALTERPIALPILKPLMQNEAVVINGEYMLLSIHRMVLMEREYFETAAVMVNGRWQVPDTGGSEGLEPGLMVNYGDDIIKLNPKKLRKKELEELREQGDFDTMIADKIRGDEEEEADEVVDERTGRTLESMKNCDSYTAKSGKGYEDKVKSVVWRVSLFGAIDGATRSACVTESEMLKVANKRAKKLERSYAGAKEKGVIVHRQGKRLLCGTTMYSAFVTVSLRRPGEDGRLMIDLNVKIKAQQNKSTGVEKRTLICLVKRLTTYEARERLKMGGCAPARDFDWWAEGARGQDVWRKLIGMLILLGGVEGGEEGSVGGIGGESVRGNKDDNSKKKKKKEKKKREGKEKEAAVGFNRNQPERVEFVERGGNDIFAYISSAYDCLPLIGIDENAGGEDEDIGEVREGVPLTEHKNDENNNGGVEWGHDANVDFERMTDRVESLSIRLSGMDRYKELVPGVTNIGNLEPFKAAPRFLPDEEADKRTMAALILRRDADTSSSNSVQCIHR